MNKIKKLILLLKEYNNDRKRCKGSSVKLLTQAAFPYMGSNNNPEPAVINKDAALLYSVPNSPEALKRPVAELHSNEKLYKEFISQERFLSTVTEYILDTITELKKCIDLLL